MIGILTFHKSVNYGSVLQAWALQRMLALKGIESEIIDYEPEKGGYLLLDSAPSQWRGTWPTGSSGGMWPTCSKRFL